MKVPFDILLIQGIFINVFSMPVVQWRETATGGVLEKKLLLKI